MSRQDCEFKTVKLEERTKKGLDELLAKEKEEGWEPRLAPALGLGGTSFILNHAINSGALRLERPKNWVILKEQKERIKKEIAMPMPPLGNKVIAGLLQKLERIRKQMQTLKQRADETKAEIARIRSCCNHNDWKYVGSNGMFPVRVCKECGEEDINIDIILS